MEEEYEREYQNTEKYIRKCAGEGDQSADSTAAFDYRYAHHFDGITGQFLRQYDADAVSHRSPGACTDPGISDAETSAAGGRGAGGTAEYGVSAYFYGLSDRFYLLYNGQLRQTAAVYYCFLLYFHAAVNIF